MIVSPPSSDLGAGRTIRARLLPANGLATHNLPGATALGLAETAREAAGWLALKLARAEHPVTPAYRICRLRAGP